MYCHFTFALVILATTTTGSRLKPVVQHENLDSSRSKGSIIWKKDQMYMCTQKWEKTSGQYQNKFCLAEIEEVIKGSSTGKAKMRASLDFRPCVAKGKDYRFKVCNLKGKADRRLNYKEKAYVPKSCFEQLPDDLSYVNKGGKKFPLMMAAVSLRACKRMFGLPHSSQRRLTKPTDFAGPISKDEEHNVEPTVVKDEKPDVPAPVNDDTVDEHVEKPVEPASMDEDLVDEKLESDRRVDEVVQQILVEDDIEDDSDGVEMGLGDMEDEEDSTANAVEDSLETQDVRVDAEKSGELDVDEASIAQIRELWKKRAEEERANRAARGA